MDKPGKYDSVILDLKEQIENTLIEFSIIYEIEQSVIEAFQDETGARFIKVKTDDEETYLAFRKINR